MKSCKLHIVGPYPPPYGGISVHIARISQHLALRGVEHKIFDQYGKDIDGNVVGVKSWLSWLFGSVLDRKKRLTHIHFPSPTFVPYYIIFTIYRYTVPGPIIISIHNERLLSYSRHLLRIYAFLIKILRAEHVLIVSERLSEALIKLGVPNVQWLPAYTPPINIEKIELINKNNNKNKRVFMNIWSLQDNKYINKYGLDLFFKLAEKYSNIHFYIFLGSNKNTNIIENIIRDNNIKNLFFYVGKNLIDELRNCDLFIRPNRDDAFGVSVQEALDLSIPSIASDVCTRPRGAILFRNGDVSDLMSKFDIALNSDKKTLLAHVETTDYHKRLMSLYNKILAEVL